MALPDFHKDFRLHSVFPTEERTDTTHTSSAIDTLAEHSICFIVACGQVSGTVDFYIEESSDSGAGDAWAKVAGSDLPQVATDGETRR